MTRNSQFAIVLVAIALLLVFANSAPRLAGWLIVVLVLSTLLVHKEMFSQGFTL